VDRVDRKRLMIATDLARTAVVAIPSLVPSSDDLVTANGRVHAGYSAAQIAGPLLAGLLITVAPVQQVLWVDAASFLVSAGTLLLIGASFNAPRTRRHGGRSATRSSTACAMSSATRSCATSRP
jgi:hypothetical protein